MRIAIAIVYTNTWKELAETVLPNIHKYANKHGYEVYERIEPMPYNGFSKLTFLNYLFKVVGVDVVMSMDLDSNITNHNITIESFLEKEKDFYVCEDINGINCGVMIWNKSKFSDWFINWLLQWEGKVDCEQNAVDKWCGNHLSYPNIKIFKESAFNDYPLEEYYPSYGKWGYKDGDVVEKPKNKWNKNSFIIHVPGLPLEKRLSILKNTPIIK